MSRNGPRQSPRQSDDDFNQFRLIYPPRASKTIKPEFLSHYKGYVAQYKYNDIRTLIYFFPDGNIELYTRHREPVREYILTAEMERSLRKLRLPERYFHVLDGGVMRGIRITHKPRERPIILWDILVHKNRYLLETSYHHRYLLLKRIAGNPSDYETETGRKVGLKISEMLWLAPIFRSRFTKRYQSAIDLPFIEGLILKDPNGKLKPGLKVENNGVWQAKVRKPAVNYPF